MNTATIIAIIEELKPLLKEKYGISKIGLFGSFARNEPDSDSDVDLIIFPDEPLGWEFFELTALLEKKFDKKVDLITPTGLKPQLKERIMKEVVYL